MVEPVVRFEAVTRRFGELVAVDGVTLDVAAGEVLALLGENGAGKSTLMKLLYGVYPASAGRILLDGRESPIRSPADAPRHGVGMVFQTFSLLPALTVRDNLLLAWPMTPWFVGRSKWWPRRPLQTLDRLAPHIDPAQRVGELSVAEQQLVELAKVLNIDARVVILDEPTSVLTPEDATRLYGFVRSLAADGIAVILITHKMADVDACADRIAIMRRGALVDVSLKGERTTGEIVRLMMGKAKDMSAAAARPAPVPRRRVERLHLRELRASVPGSALHGISLSVAAGEIVGIAGVAGNGQTLLAEAVAGLASLADGDVVLDGVSIARRGEERPEGTPLGYIPEQPRANGVVEDLSVADNLDLRRFGRVPSDGVDAPALLERFDIRPREPGRMAGTLSGGNLQKLVIARELSVLRAGVLACYPTMGLDLGATAAVYASLFEQARAGAAVLWISEELDDLLAHAHRIAVLHEGRFVAVIDNDGTLTREAIGALMTGGEKAEAAA
jgi:simple sugar transport system ATP-binding protein